VKRPDWTVTPCSHGAVTVAGLPLEDMLFYALDSIAASIHDGDGRAQAWTDYVIARGNLAGAQQRGESGAALDELGRIAGDAWHELAPELAATMRLDTLSARMLADGLFEAAGHIGTVAP
jgi:hypothetical protein